MIVKVVNFFFIMGILMAMSCASPRSASKSGDGGYYEDLSAYRPDYSAALDTMESAATANVEEETINIYPQYHVTDDVNMLLDSIRILKSKINHVDGLTIQVYTGINREQANEAKAKVYTTLPDSRPVIIYNQPNFKVRVGKFYTRREAQDTFARLKRVFPAAIILPERIPIGDND
jgi:hypothetical protein